MKHQQIQKFWADRDRHRIRMRLNHTSSLYIVEMKKGNTLTYILDVLPLDTELCCL